MREIQREHAEWLEKMYPGQTPWMPAVGLVEEAAELLHCVLKKEQEGQWGRDPRHGDIDWREEMVDAIGDCGIFAVSLCNACGWDFIQLWDLATCCDLTEDLGTPKQLALDLVEAGLTIASAPTRLKLIVYLGTLIRVARACGTGAVCSVWSTWQKVKGRTR